ncbi:hypothetical protein CIW83_05890 [Tissierella sp. P1]|jgi:uncharacterized protein YacL|uniref:DUF6608 family protein n=1 Tax=Tissierella TaxID=41273 RepID=UPI000BA15A6D|nr:DUF6608 family protein [Tissierella sp. P1]MDU5081240.1 DUF6608 family protein [Bacillota bacterium]OZV13070.1 hypothetical protein CIW83_05890 [Tissierella sp. P1]
MKIIDKKTFIPTVCVVYTILSMSKIILEAIIQNEFGNYQSNLLMMIFVSFIATLVLSQHYRLQQIPLPLVIIGQYLVLIGIILLIIWISGLYTDLHPNAYRDMFLSFTIPYIIGAAIYYLNVFWEVKNANQMLKNIKKKGD